MKKAFIFSLLLVGEVTLSANAVEVPQVNIIYREESTPLTVDRTKVAKISFTTGENVPDDLVDMGMTITVNGEEKNLMWSKYNLGTNSEYEPGDFYAWGETVPKHVFNWKDYKFSKDDSGTAFTKYTTTNAALELEDDAAYVNSPWECTYRIPTPTEWNLLKDTNNYTWTKVGTSKETTDEKITNGYLVKSNKTGNSIFLGAFGIMRVSMVWRGTNGYYWTNALTSDDIDYAFALCFNDNWVPTENVLVSNVRCEGLPIRPVSEQPLNPETVKKVTIAYNNGSKTVSVERSKVKKITFTNKEVIPDLVDMGMTITDADGNKKNLAWAKWNVGATSERDPGDYFAWGEVKTKDSYIGANYKWTNDECGSFTKYTTAGQVLESEDDAATVNMGKGYRIPTAAEWQLFSDSKYTWTIEGDSTWGKISEGEIRNGLRVTNSSTGNSIFFPACGYMYKQVYVNKGTCGYYWSSTVSSQQDVLGKYRYVNCALFPSLTKMDLNSDTDNRETGRPVRAVYELDL